MPWHGVVFRQIEDMKATLELVVAWRSDHHAALIERFVGAARFCIEARG